MKLVIRKNFSLGFAILLVLFLFQDPIGNALPAFQSFDEIESIICAFIIFWSVVIRKRKLLDKMQKKYIHIVILLIVVGLIGNMISSYQNFMFIFLDIFVYSKLTLNVVAADVIISKRKMDRYEDTAWKVASIAATILLLLVIHETFSRTTIWPYMSDRYGVRSLKLFFTNQTYLAQIGVILLIIHYVLGETRRGSNFFCIIDMLISASTFRAKALGFIMVAAIIIFVIGKKKVLTKFNIIIFGVLLTIAAVMVGYDYLTIYYLSGNESTLRFRLLLGGIKLASMHIPFGTGFGTYCSLGAKLNYSAAYDILGMQRIYRWDSMYDNFWASILGQFGYLGCFLYLVSIIRLVLIIWEIRQINIKKFWAGMLVCIYLVIASIAEASFNAFYACFMGIFIGYLYREVKWKEPPMLGQHNHY